MIAAAVELLQQLAHAADRTGLNAISKQPKAVVVGHLGIGGQRLGLVCPCLAFIDALARGERMIEHNSKLTFPCCRCRHSCAAPRRLRSLSPRPPTPLGCSVGCSRINCWRRSTPGLMLLPPATRRP